MPPTLETLTVKDGLAAGQPLAVLDRDGAGGAYAAAHALVNTVNLIDVTFSLDTSAFASGDVLADTQVVAGAFFENDGQGILHSLALVDKDDQKVAMTVLLFSANVALGTENSAPSISDANAANFLGAIDITAGDWRDLGGVSVCELSGLGKIVKAASGTKDIYVALLNGTGTPTFTASGIVGRFGFLPG